MATLAQIRSAIDTRLEALWPTLVTRQTTYAANHGGRFFQGIKTHVAPPTEGDAKAADNLAAKPTDQVATWAAFGVPSWLESFSVEISVYDGPLGVGWVATVAVGVLGKVYSRSRGVGPEDRNKAWAEVVA